VLEEMEDMTKGRCRSTFTLRSETANLGDMMMMKGAEGGGE